MALTANVAAALLAAGLGGAPGPQRLLLCRPVVAGDPALARAEAVAQAGMTLGGRFLDYGVVCDGEAEASRAARRAGLRLAVSSRAEGRTDGSRFTLALSGREEETLARRELAVAPGADAVAPLARALAEMARAAEPPPPEGKGAGPWITVGAGAAALAAGAVLAVLAKTAADDRDRARVAGDAATYVRRDADWSRWRTASGVALGVGGAAVAAGLAWRFAF